MREALERTAPACRSVGYPASDCWKCRDSDCGLLSGKRKPLSARVAAARARSGTLNRYLCHFSESFKKRPTRESLEVKATVPLVVSSYLLNEKRSVLSEIETQSNTRVVIVPNPEMQTPIMKLSGLTGMRRPTRLTPPPNQLRRHKSDAQHRAASGTKTRGQQCPPARAPSEKKDFRSVILGLAGLFSGSPRRESPRTKTPAQKRRGNRNSRSRNQRGQQFGNDRNSNQSRRDKRDARDDGNQNPEIKSAENLKARQTKSLIVAVPEIDSGEREPKQEKQGKSNRDQNRRRRSSRGESDQIQNQIRAPVVA